MLAGLKVNDVFVTSGGDEPTTQKAGWAPADPTGAFWQRQVCYQTIRWCSCLGTNGSRGTASDREGEVS